MADTARSFHCEFENAPCADPRCKKDYCVLEHEVQQRSAARAAAEADKYHLKAQEVARDILSKKGINDPTEQQVRDLARHPKIVAEAMRRVSALQDPFRAKISN
jgi:hypothetical protein